MRAFAIVDTSQRASKRKPCATLLYDEDTREYRIEIAPDAGEDDVPMLLIPFIWRKQRTLDATWSRTWVRERIVPPSRQNLGQILKANGLDDYDDFQLLMIGGGRCSQDDFALEEIDAETLAHWPLTEPDTADLRESAQAPLDEPEAAAAQGPARTPADARPQPKAPSLAEQAGLQLLRARKAAGLSQHELAGRCGLDQAAISRLERGRGNPTLSLLADVASQLGVHITLTVE